MTERSQDLNARPLRGDEDYERALRPTALADFIGQQQIKDNLRIFMTAALQRGEALDHVLLSGPPGLGKCITPGSLILTRDGWVTLQSLIPGPMAPGTTHPLAIDVYGIDGPEQTSHLYASGVVPTLRVATRCGFVLEGTPHHPVLVATPEGPHWLPLAALRPGDAVALAYNVDLSDAALPFTPNPEADAAYRAGLQAGKPVAYAQGQSRRFTASEARSEALVLEALAAEERATEVDPAGVPAAVLAGSRAVVAAFLQGLFDATGQACTDGAVVLAGCSAALSQAVQLLLAQHGIMATRRQQGTSASWQLYIAAGEAPRFHDRFGFRTPHKQALRHPSTGEGYDDVIPHAAGLLAALTKAYSRPPFGPCARQQVLQTLAILPRSAEQRAEYAALTALLHPTLRWDAVATVQQGMAEAYDFVVPGTHSFVANGFYNHNTTLALIVAEEMGAGIKSTSGPVLDKPANIAGLLTNLNEGDVLFIDEIHRLNPVVEEYLYSAMEDYHIDILIDAGPNARSVKLSLPPFTLIGATTRKGLLTAPLRARFGIDFRYDYYTADLLLQIVKRSASILGVSITDEGAFEIARRSRGTPRVANRLLRRTRDFAEVEGDGSIDQMVADRALNALNVDEVGLDDMDARILLTLIEKFGGGPTGLSNLAVSVGEDTGTIEEVYEPYLILEGFMERTARGRVATPRAYAHFGMEPPVQTGDLFEV